MGLGEKNEEKRKRGEGKGKGKREKGRGKERKKGRGKGKGKRGKRRDLDFDLFRAPKHSIILLKSKNFLCKGGSAPPAPPRIRNLSNTPVFKPWVRGKNMILKRGGSKNMSLKTNIHPWLTKNKIRPS